MIKPLLILLLILPFIFLGYKSIDLAIYKRRRGSTYMVKEYPVFFIGCALFVVAGVLISKFKLLLNFL
ncbi:MAG: hypothetical protein AAF617_04355 [Bacteroidota bacterium]